MAAIQASKKIATYGNKPNRIKGKYDRRFLPLPLNPSSRRIAPAIQKAKPSKVNVFILCRSESAKAGSALPISNRRKLPVPKTNGSGAHTVLSL